MVSFVLSGGQNDDDDDSKGIWAGGKKKCVLSILNKISL